MRYAHLRGYVRGVVYNSTEGKYVHYLQFINCNYK